MSTYFTTVYTTGQNTADNDYVYITANGVLEQGLSIGRNTHVYVQGYSELIGDYTGTGSASADNINIAASGLVGLVSLDGNLNSVSNAGVITSGIELDIYGFYYAGKANIITNTGLIESVDPEGSSFIPISSKGIADTEIYNSGTISNTRGNAIGLDTGNDKIVNSGSIFGNISLGDGNNRLNSATGSIFGTITAGNGGNTIRTGDVDAVVNTGSGGDTIHGGAGDDTIDSGNGADALFGGGGDDTMHGGVGTVDSLKGQDGDDALYGDDGTDYLFGGEGSDLLDGGDNNGFTSTGNFLYGGAGDDTYNVHNTYDFINERDIYEGSGVDSVIVYEAFDFSLSDKTHVKGDLENLVLQGVTQLEDINGTGNKLDNLIYGTDGGANVLSGLAGDDELYGRLGNDTLDGGAGADLLDGGSGTDTATYESSASSVTVALDGSIAATGDALGDTFTSIEWLRGANVAGAGDTLRGTNTANSIFGLLGDDTINGRGGADKLIGGQGSDTLTGEGGNDSFTYYAASEGGDSVTDFTSGADDFRFKGSAFAGLTAGTYSSANFVSRGDHLAQDGNDYFIFQTTDTTLWFDADGNGAGAAVMIADLQAAATMVFSDITIF